MFTEIEMFFVFAGVIFVCIALLIFTTWLQHRRFLQDLDDLRDSDMGASKLLMRAKEAVSKNTEVRSGHEKKVGKVHEH